MKLTGGKSYNNGIDFTVKDGNESFVYSSRRNANDELETSRKVMYERSNSNAFLKTVISAVLSISIVLILEVFKGFENSMYSKLGWIMVIAVFWCGFLAYMLFDGRSSKNQATKRYHAVEHKILNFYTEYGYLPRTTDDLEKMSSVYICCGSTIAVVIALFATLSILCLMLIPTIILKVVGIAVSAVVVFFLWAFDKCNFAQKWQIASPTHKEIELGICAMYRLSKEISVL